MEIKKNFSLAEHEMLEVGCATSIFIQVAFKQTVKVNPEILSPCLFFVLVTQVGLLRTVLT